MRRRPVLGVALAWGGLLFGGALPVTAPVIAQDPPRPQAADEFAQSEVTQAQITEALQNLRDDLSRDQATRERLTEIYDASLTSLNTAAEWTAKAASFEQARQDAPAALEALRAELDVPVVEVTIEFAPDARLAELEQSLTQSEAELSAARKLVADLELEHQNRDNRRTQVPTLLADARARLDAIELELGVAPAADADAAESRARRQRDLARRQAIRAEIEAYDRELLSYEERGNLLAARRERAARRLAQAENLARQWRLKVSDQRRIEAERDALAAQAAVADAADSHEFVVALADDNAALAETRTGADGLLARIEAADRQADVITSLLELLRERSLNVKNKVDAVGKTPAIGLMLVDQRAGLPDLRVHRQDLAKRRDDTSGIQLAKIDIADEANRLVDLDRAVNDALAELGNVGQVELAEIRRAMREQYQLRRRLLADLSRDYSTYVEKITELDIKETQLIEETEAFGAYIDERVLWVRTAAPLHTELSIHWRQATEAAAWLFDPSTWRELLRRSTGYLQEMPLSHGVQLLVLLLLVLGRRGIRRRIANDAYLVGRIRTDRFMHTVHALVFTTLRALPLPLLLWCLASMLVLVAPDIPLAGATAEGLRVTAVGCLVAELIWAASRPGGLCEAHFRWPAEQLRLLRRNLRWMVWIGLPTLFVVAALGWRDTGTREDSLERLGFVVGHLALSVFAYRVLRPTTGVLSSAIERNPTGWLSRLRWLWFPLAVGLPLLLAAMAEVGYVYTGNQLTDRMQASGFLVLGLVAVYALMLRWLFVARRQLALQQYRKRRAAAQADADAGEPRSMTSMSDEFVEEESIDIPSVSAQSQRLVQVLIGVSLVAGLMLIWIDVLPALQVFDEIKLWSHAVEIEDRDPSAADDGSVIVRKKLLPVTLADLFLAMVALALTVAAARNVPGLLEISVLQRLPLQRAGRYAITTISRYIIVIIGIVLMFGAVGVGWAKVQWLAAAVTVGLGFGLQEIFANFVSGLILLFERPVRIGDTVTVNDVTGTVTKIRMRATTIMTWDRTELVVPNRDFITSQLVNWTLSDSVLRVIIKVGIAYGSDTAKAEQILQKIAADQPDVLDDPAPRIVFQQFGDSTLDFELRVFVADPELYRRIQHPINNAIDREFRAAGIEIAFPQRDLHLRTVTSVLPVSLGNGEAGIAAAAVDPPG